MAEFTLLQWFLFGFAALIIFRMISQQPRRTPARNQGGIFGLAFLAHPVALILVISFSVVYVIGGLWKVFFPPAQPIVPIWMWVVIGFFALIIIKILAERR